MRARYVLLMALMILPATLTAQRRSGGGRGLGAGGSSREADAMIRDLADAPSLSKDLQKQNPLEIILDRKKDLKLTDDEQKELKSMSSALKDSLKPYFKTIDSAQRAQRKQGAEEPTQGQMIVLRGILREASDSVRAHYERATPSAMARLSEEHRQPATEALQKEMEEQMAARRGARGGRPPV